LPCAPEDRAALAVLLAAACPAAAAGAEGALARAFTALPEPSPAA